VLAGNVRSTLRVSGSDEKFRRRLHVTAPVGSQVVAFSFSDSSADRARQIAQEAAVVLTQLVASKFGAAHPPLQARILDAAHVVSGGERHVWRDVLYGAVAGLLVALAVLAVAGSRTVVPADQAAARREVRKREGLLERRLDEVTRRERALARRAGELAVREQTARDREARLEAQALQEARAAPSPTPPAPAPPPVAPVPAAPVPPPPEPVEITAAEVAAAPPEPLVRSDGGGWNLDDLERRVASDTTASDQQREEWRTYIFFLRDHAQTNGDLPPSFDSLVEDVFGDLIARSR
jgi:hypothetical protein